MAKQQDPSHRKIGVALTIDPTKLDKSAFIRTKSGKVLFKVTTFINFDEESQYGDHGFITQDLGQDRKDEKGDILGNSKVFWQSESFQEALELQTRYHDEDGGYMPEPVKAKDDFQDVDVPF